jgi:hypothetical protein
MHEAPGTQVHVVRGGRWWLVWLVAGVPSAEQQQQRGRGEGAGAGARSLIRSQQQQLAALRPPPTSGLQRASELLLLASLFSEIDHDITITTTDHESLIPSCRSWGWGLATGSCMPHHPSDIRYQLATSAFSSYCRSRFSPKWVIYFYFIAYGPEMCLMSWQVLGPVLGVGVVAKRPQGWVKCEDRLPYYKGSSCSLPLATIPRPRLRDSRGPRRGRPGSRARSSGVSWVSCGAWPGRTAGRAESRPR